MAFSRRRKASTRWPLIAASALAAAAAFFAWAILLRERDTALTDDELREVEAFDEYERRKRSEAR